MNSKHLLLFATMALAAAGCQQTKSSNPLSPSVAGPIPGVDITAPKLLTPTVGAQIENGSQPVTLTLANATTSGVRPLTYLIEVAMDADFSNKVVSRDGLAPGEGGQTTFRLPEALAADRTYYWRARAQDGANTGPYSGGAYFSVFTPIVLQAPGLGAPINDVRVAERNPTLVVSNAARTGPVGSIVYEFHVSTTQTFSSQAAIVEQPEQAGSTRVSVGYDLPYESRFYWRARAWEMTKNMPGPWSAVASFQTPLAPPPPPPTAPPPTPGGGGAVGHVAAGPLTVSLAEEVVYNTSREFPGLTAVYSNDDAALNAAEELLLRTIWHLQLIGFQAGRQQNPSGAISKDKLTIFIDGSWHAYDTMSLGYAGRATTVQFVEVFPANYVPDAGIRD